MGASHSLASYGPQDTKKSRQAEKSQCTTNDLGCGDSRLSRLAAVLASPAVQIPEMQDTAIQEPARLSSNQVRQVFIQHVPGVQQFTYRGSPGKYSLNFIEQAYAAGIQKFQSTELHSHYLNLLRLVVHQAYDGKPGADRCLREIAEAFMDCQDVQARVIEREGLKLQGTTLDFLGHVVKLAGDYKRMAVMQVAIEETGSMNTIHFENWISLEVGDRLGLDKADIRRARHDAEVDSRFHRMNERERKDFEARIRGCLDVRAMLQAFCAEVNAFSENSPADSFARQFLDWTKDAMADPHGVFDETCMHVEVNEEKALDLLEILFLGSTAS